MNKIINKIKYKIKYKNCSISADTKIEKGAKLNTCNIGSNCDIRKNVSIDKYTYINNNSNVMCAQIGKYCSIGYGVDIGMFEHPTDMVSTSPKLYDEFNCIKNIPVIGNDVWIGSKAIILQGVKIGTGAIIGAGAVVTKDVPPYAIVVGVPAKIIKYRFDSEIIDKLLCTKWWNNDEKWIRKNKNKFMNIKVFLDGD